MFQNNLNLTANEILEKEFKIDTRGYRLKEVDQYLDLIIQDYETFIKIIEQLSKENQKLINLMINKSQDSFLLAIELYNKPTITLNVEDLLFLFAMHGN